MASSWPSTRIEEAPIRDLDVYLPSITAGDADAFARWLACAEAGLRRGLRRFAAVADTEAVLQETLLRVWQVAHRYPGDGRPNGLLRLAARIARNLAVSEARRRRLGTVELEAARDDAVLDTGAGSEPDAELVRAIQRCREALPRQPARALAARLDGAGQSPDRSLALGLGMRLNTFLQNITRARRLLADCLRRRGFDLGQVVP